MTARPDSIAACIGSGVVRTLPLQRPPARTSAAGNQSTENTNDTTAVAHSALSRRNARGSESSAYTERDVPIFTCVKMPVQAILDQLDGAR
jgi:hypothetical protein